MTFLPLAKEFTIFGVSGYLVILGALALLVILVFGLRKLLAKNGTSEEPTEIAQINETVVSTETAETTPTEETAEEPDVSYIPGYVTLNGISEQDAAVIMAITSFRTGIDLERLAFRSIKRLNQDPVLENVSEQDAAVIMAITSNKTGIPLENLAFNSIKLVEE